MTRKLHIQWEIDVEVDDNESEYDAALQVSKDYFRSDLIGEEMACCFTVIEEGSHTTMVDLSSSPETREQRLERLASLLLSQIKDLDRGSLFESDITAEANPVTKQLKALLGGAK